MTSNFHLNITRENFSQVVKDTIKQCTSQLDATRNDSTKFALVHDLEIALTALRLIDSELRDKKSRPKGQRSGIFTRYVVDEQDRMALAPSLRDEIMQIENFYARSI